MVQPEFKIGETVMWRGGFGNWAPQPAVIADIGYVDGQPVYFDLSNGHWAYGHQLMPSQSEVTADVA